MEAEVLVAPCGEDDDEDLGNGALKENVDVDGATEGDDGLMVVSIE